MIRPGFQPNLREDWLLPVQAPIRPPHDSIHELAAYTYAMPTINTIDLAMIRTAIDDVQEFNAARPLGSRRLVALNAAPHHGKTTMVLSVALRQARDAWALETERATPSIQWAYVSATSRGEGRSVASDLAAFCDLPKTGSRPTAADHIGQLSKLARPIGLHSVFVDDVHSLKSDVGKNGRSVADSLKGLISTVPATFVLAGVDLRAHPLFADVGRGRVAATQLVNRAEWIDLRPWPTHDRHGGYDELWLRLLAEINNYLIFPRGDRQNRLNTHATIDYLLQGCGGRPGTAIEWIQLAAVWAIKTGNNLDKAALATRRGRQR